MNILIAVLQLIQAVNTGSSDTGSSSPLNMLSNGS